MVSASSARRALERNTCSLSSLMRCSRSTRRTAYVPASTEAGGVAVTDVLPSAEVVVVGTAGAAGGAPGVVVPGVAPAAGVVPAAGAPGVALAGAPGAAGEVAGAAVGAGVVVVGLAGVVVVGFPCVAGCAGAA